MSRVSLADAIRDVTGCTNAQANEAVGAVTEVIAKSLKKEGKFGLVGFGTFMVSKRGARKGRNPQTGATITIKASKSVRFKASSTLKKRM
jgi:DNA-binding protein HU-beta